MMLRLQLERMTGAFVPSAREYFRFYGLDREKLAVAKPGALVMHPGPMNRGVEIASDIADDVQVSLIAEQVEMGVAIRMAILDAPVAGAWHEPPHRLPQRAADRSGQRPGRQRRLAGRERPASPMSARACSTMPSPAIPK